MSDTPVKTLSRHMALTDLCPEWGFGLHDVGPGCWCEPDVWFETEDVGDVLYEEGLMMMVEHQQVNISGLRKVNTIQTVCDGVPMTFEA